MGFSPAGTRVSYGRSTPDRPPFGGEQSAILNQILPPTRQTGYLRMLFCPMRYSLVTVLVGQNVILSDAVLTCSCWTECYSVR